MAIKKREPPQWGKDAMKVLIDRNMSVIDCARELGCSRGHLSSVLNGRVISDDMRHRICSFLGVQVSNFDD